MHGHEGHSLRGVDGKDKQGNKDLDVNGQLWPMLKAC